MKLNALVRQAVVEVTFDDLVMRPDGGVVFHPDLTTHISGEQWANVYNALALSNRLGSVMNVHVTILWSQLGLRRDSDVSARLVRWTSGFRKWCGGHSYPCRYVYAHEYSPRQGLHTHLLTAVPFTYRKSYKHWATKHLALLSRVEPMPPVAICIRHRRGDDVERQWLWFGYLMKGVDYEIQMRDVADKRLSYRLGDLMLYRHRYGGVVRCVKRVGVSRNLDVEARHRFSPEGFWSVLDEGASTRAALYTDHEFRSFREEQERKQVIKRLEQLGSLPVSF